MHPTDFAHEIHIGRMQTLAGLVTSVFVIVEAAAALVASFVVFFFQVMLIHMPNF